MSPSASPSLASMDRTLCSCSSATAGIVSEAEGYDWTEEASPTSPGPSSAWSRRCRSRVHAAYRQSHRQAHRWDVDISTCATELVCIQCESLALATCADPTT